MINELLDSRVVLLIDLLVSILFIFVLKKKKLSKNSSKALLIIYIVFTICLYFSYFLKYNNKIIYIFMGIWLAFLVIALLITKIFKIYNSKVGIFFVFSVIMLVQLCYISYTPFYVRQHDMRDFYKYENGGHLGYIGYIFYNNKLPSVNPMDYWCFYNPPLFYIISAIFIKIQNGLGIAIQECLENLQILTFVYVAIFNFFVYKILKEMKIKNSLPYVLSFVGLTPIMLILSGSIGNGTLSVALSTMAIYYTIKWYNSDSLKDLVKIAFSISLAIMTKIDSALIAILIAIVFLIKVIKNRVEFKKYIKYFSIFAIISLPIGLWYPIKNFVVYDVPFNFVQSVERDHPSNVEEHSILERFFTIKSFETLQNINIKMDGEEKDYNIPITTIKSMIVDEEIDYSENKILDVVVHSIFVLSIVIAIIFVINLVYLIKNYKKINNHWILFFLGLLIIESFAYIQFCFNYPFVFTMNFRYIIPTLISFAVLTGIASENNKILLNINKYILMIFSVCSIIMFFLI